VLFRSCSHYQSGADFLVVRDHVLNTAALVPRFIEAQNTIYYENNEWVDWSEGFSCRRDAALHVGLFSEDTPIALCDGADVYFSRKLRAAGYKGILDRSIVMYHVAPESFREYLSQRIERGRGSTLIKTFVYGIPRYLVGLHVVARSMLSFMKVMLIIPLSLDAWRVSKYSPRGRMDLGGFCITELLQLAGMCFGKWKGLTEIMKIS